MKSITITLAICLAVSSAEIIVPQSSDNDLYEIHSAVIKSLDNNRYNVFNETKTTYLEYFDFTLNSNLSDNQADILYRPDWQKFIKGIDTTKIKNYKLSSGNRLWFKQHNRDRTNIVFAPIIMSLSQKKALSVFHMFNGDSPGGYMAAYLELSNKRWVVKKIETFVYLD